MEDRLSAINIFFVAVVSTLGVKVTNLAWTKFIEPKVNKK